VYVCVQAQALDHAHGGFSPACGWKLVYRGTAVKTDAKERARHTPNKLESTGMYVLASQPTWQTENGHKNRNIFVLSDC
jgi:hypothetical protein